MVETVAPAASGRKFKSKKKLTLPTFKLLKDAALYALIMGPIHRGKQRGTPKKRPDGTDEDPPMLCHVVNVETGEHGQIMVAKIIEIELTEQYPDCGYIGKAFGIKKGERKEGKRYDPYEIEEIEIPPELAEASAAAVKEFNASEKPEPGSAAPSADKEESDKPAAAPPRRRN